jgi:hypothetical protein
MARKARARASAQQNERSRWRMAAAPSIARSAATASPSAAGQRSLATSHSVANECGCAAVSECPAGLPCSSVHRRSRQCASTLNGREGPKGARAGTRLRFCVGSVTVSSAAASSHEEHRQNTLAQQLSTSKRTHAPATPCASHAVRTPRSACKAHVIAIGLFRSLRQQQACEGRTSMCASASALPSRSAAAAVSHSCARCTTARACSSVDALPWMALAWIATSCSARLACHQTGA